GSATTARGTACSRARIVPILLRLRGRLLAELPQLPPRPSSSDVNHSTFRHSSFSLPSLDHIHKADKKFPTADPAAQTSCIYLASTILQIPTAKLEMYSPDRMKETTTSTRDEMSRY